MGVYINTFRTEHKTALLNGQPVKVFAYRYLCKAQDVDNYGNPWGRKSAALLRSQCEQAAKRFEAHKPAFGAEVFEDSWDGATVYANPKGACHYDTEPLTKEPIGFLVQQAGSRAYANGAKGWAIVGERHREDSPIYCGLTVRRAYVEKIGPGVPYSMTAKSFTFSNGVTFTPEQFETWQLVETPKYLAACQAARDAQAERERLAYATRQSLDACSL